MDKFSQGLTMVDLNKIQTAYLRANKTLGNSKKLFGFAGFELTEQEQQYVDAVDELKSKANEQMDLIRKLELSFYNKFLKERENNEGST
jgi:hypothetical protein